MSIGCKVFFIPLGPTRGGAQAVILRFTIELLVTSYINIINFMAHARRLKQIKANREILFSLNSLVVEQTPGITFALIDESRGVTENSMSGSCGKAISVLPHTPPATEIAHFPPLAHNILFIFNILRLFIQLTFKRVVR